MRHFLTVIKTWFCQGVIYKDKTGHILGWFDNQQKMWYVAEFVVNPEYRNKGYGTKLATHLPEGKCYLHPHPLTHLDGEHIPQDKLIDFYSKLGFVLQTHEPESLVKTMIRYS